MPTFPAVVRPYPLPSHHLLSQTSDLQGTVNDSTTLPAPVQVARLVPLVLRAPPRCRPRPAHHSRLRRVWFTRTPPRWAPRCQPHRTQPHRRASFTFSLLYESWLLRQFDAVLVDYLHKRKFSTLGPLLMWTLRVTTVVVGVGVYHFNTNDIGGSETLASTRPSFTTDVFLRLPGFT